MDRLCTDRSDGFPKSFCQQPSSLLAVLRSRTKYVSTPYAKREPRS
jgi:hypothetical protein